MKQKAIESIERTSQQLVLYFSKGPLRRLFSAIFTNLSLHHGPQLASAMAFDLFLALIPLLALGGWAISLVLRGDIATLAHLSVWLDVTPSAVHELVNQHAERFSGRAIAPIAFFGAVYLASGAFDTVMAAFERTLPSAPRSWWVRRGVAVVCVLCFLAALSLGAWVALQLAGGPALVFRLLPKPYALDDGGLDIAGPRVVGISVSIVTITLLIAGFFRIGVRRDVPRRRVWPGTFVTMFIAAFASYLFAVYAQTIARFALYYGSLAAVAILMAWLWLCSFALLLGAEVNVYLESNPGALRALVPRYFEERRMRLRGSGESRREQDDD